MKQGNRTDLKDNPADKLTRKQKAYADYKLVNPTVSNTEAAIQTYNTEDRRTAAQIAIANERNPAVKSYLSKHSKQIEELIASKTYELTEREDIQSISEGLKNARWIHDKIHGTATKKTESTSVNLNIETALDEILGD